MVRTTFTPIVIKLSKNNMDIDEETAEEYREPKHNVHEMTTFEIAEKEKWEDYYREARLGII